MKVRIGSVITFMDYDEIPVTGTIVETDGNLDFADTTVTVMSPASTIGYRVELSEPFAVVQF